MSLGEMLTLIHTQSYSPGVSSPEGYPNKSSACQCSVDKFWGASLIHIFYLLGYSLSQSGTQLQHRLMPICRRLIFSLYAQWIASGLQLATCTSGLQEQEQNILLLEKGQSSVCKA